MQTDHIEVHQRESDIDERKYRLEPHRTGNKNDRPKKLL